MFLIWHMFSVLALLVRSDRARFAVRSFSRLPSFVPFFTRWCAALGSAHPRGDLWLMKSTPSLAYFEESEERERRREGTDGRMGKKEQAQQRRRLVSRQANTSLAVVSNE